MEDNLSDALRGMRPILKVSNMQGAEIKTDGQTEARNPVIPILRGYFRIELAERL